MQTSLCKGGIQVPALSSVWIFVLLLFSSMALKAQTITSTVSDLVRCGDQKEFIVSVKASDPLSNYSFSLSLPEGVYFTTIDQPSWNPSFSPGTSSLIFTPGDFAGGEEKILRYSVQAGCLVAMNGAATKAVTLTITAPNGVLAGNNSFTINEGINGDLEPVIQSTGYYNNSSNVGKKFTRTFQLKNGPSKTFSGYIQFSNVLPTSLVTRSLVLTLPNGSTVPLSKAEPVFVANILAGQIISITEELEVVTCIQTGALEKVDIKWGCTKESLCRSYNIDANTTEDSDKYVIKMSNRSKDKLGLFSCFGETESRTESVTYKNTGNVSAKDLVFHFSVNTIFKYISPSSFKVTIVSKDGTTKVFSVVRAIENQVPKPDNDYSDLYKTDGSLDSWFELQYSVRRFQGGLENFKDCIIPIYKYVGFKENYVCDNVTDYDFAVNRLVISHIKDMSGNISKIDLAAGEEIMISWEEKNCCFTDKFTSQPYVNYLDQPTINVYGVKCNSNSLSLENSEFTGLMSYNLAQKVPAFKALLKGNPDYCFSTIDGEIKEFVIENKSFSFYHQWSSMNKGKIMVELSLSEGVDLDLSLDGNALEESYDHIACSDNENCSATCGNLWTNPEKFRVKIVNEQFPFVWMPESIIKVSGTYPGPTKYLAAFNLDDFTNQNPMINYVNYFISAKIKFSVRSYCIGGEGEAAIKERVLYQPACEQSCALPLASEELKLTIVCPGCKTPGGNVNEATFTRNVVSTGLVDNVNKAGNQLEDGAPDDGAGRVTDELLLANVTNGDIIDSKIIVTLSNGEEPEGYLLSQVPYQIDHLYVKMAFTREDLVHPVAGSATVRFEGNTYPIADPVIVSDTEYVYKVSASNLGITKFDDKVLGRNINIQSRFKVDNNLDATGNKALLVYIKYQSYFSDCNDCDTWIFPGNDAKNQTPQTLQPNSFFFCSGYTSVFTFVPSELAIVKYVEDATKVNGINNHCIKTVNLTHQARFFDGERAILNAFPKEYRNLIAGKSGSIKYSCIIPPGYTVTKIEITNQGQTYLPGAPVDNYSITGENINSYITNSVFNINLSYTNLMQSDIGKHNTLPYTSGTLLRAGDDHISTQVKLFLEPENCENLYQDVVYFNGSIDPTKVARMPYIIEEPTLTLPFDFLNRPIGSYIFPQYNTGFIPITKPTTNLTASYNNKVDITKSGKIFLPVNFINSFPVDANNNPMKDVINSKNLQSIDAKFPYVFIKNLNDLKDKGFQFELYEGEFNESKLPNVPDLFNADGIASLKSNNGVIPANSQAKYTLGITYNCPDNCNAILPSCLSGDNEIPECIKEIKKVDAYYGWSCSNVPTKADLENGEPCIQNPMPIELNTFPVAIELTTSIEETEVKTCSNFNYNVIVESCKPGSISDVSFTLTLPDGISYVGNDKDYQNISTATNTVVFQLINANDFSFNNGSTISFNITLRSDCNRLLDGKEIVALINGATYCNRIIKDSKTKIQLEALDLVNFDPISIQSTQFTNNNNQLKVTYELTGPATHYNEIKVSLAEGLREAGTGNTNLVIPINETSAGIYTTIVNIESVAPICSGTYTSNVILSREYRETCLDKVCTIMIDEQSIPVAFTVTPLEITLTGPDAGCEGELITLTANVLPQANYTYKWFADNMELSGETSPTLNVIVNSTADYKVEITDSKGCVVTETIAVRLKSKIECCKMTLDLGPDRTICSNQSITITAPVNGVSYLWSPGGETTQSITVNPSVNTVYSVQISDGVCSASDELEVIVNAIPIVTIDNLNTIYCVDNTGIQLEGTPAGGTFSGALVANGIFTPSIAGFTTVNYAYTDANGCSNIVSRLVEIKPVPQLSISGLKATYCMSDIQILVTGQPAGGVFSGDINGNIFTPSKSGLNIINYTYTDSYGCSNAVSKEIFVHILPTVNIVNLADEYCYSLTPVTLQGNPAGGVFTVDGSITTQFIPSNVGKNIITYSYKNVNGCTNTVTKEVVVNQGLEVSVTGQSESCIGSTYTLNAQVSSGTPGYSYQWFQNGVAIPSATQSVYSFTASAASGGNYSVLVTDSKGCKKESGFITVQPKNCCTYAIGDATAVCGEESIICVPLQAIRNVPHGIIGMDFCLEYNPNFVTPTGNATLGNVVINGAVANSNGKFFLNKDTRGYVRVTISYDYSQPNAASSFFKGTGDVICIEFKANSNIAGTVINNIFKSCQLDEAYTLTEKPGCLEKTGSLSYIKNMNAKGSVIYHSPISFTGDHILKYSGFNSNNRYPLISDGKGYLETNIQGITGNCANPQGPLANTDIDGEFEIDAHNFSAVKVSRDIKGEYGSSDCEPVLSYLNGMDAYYMEHITTLKLFSVHDNRNFIPSAYQMIAADVNMNDKVRANDVTLLQERAVLKICEFPQVWNYTVGTDPNLQPQPGKKSVDWRFYSFSNNVQTSEFYTPKTYPNTSGINTYWRDNVPGGLVAPGMIPNCINLNSSRDQRCVRFLNTTIHAVLLGDIDRNWVTKYNIPGSPYLRTANVSGKISFKLNEAYLVGEGVYRVPVQVESDSGIVAIDFDMDYNEDQIEIKSVNKKQLAIDAEARLMYNDYNLKRLFVTSYSMTGFGTVGTPYYIDIYSKDGIIEKEDLGTIKGYINGEDAKVEVVTGVTTVEHPEYLVGVEMSVVPNPASGITKIIYNAGNNSEVNSLLVTDAVGKVVREFHNLTATGEVEFDVSDLSAGMYYCNFRGKSGMKLVTKFTIVK